MKASFLRPKDQVALIAPAGLVSEEQLNISVQNIEMMGYTPIFSTEVLQKNGYLAGSDLRRASEINQAFANPDIKAVYCIRGGYGTMRLLPLLDFDLIRKNPKLMIGYSDITALLQAIYRKTGLIGFHAPMLAVPLTAYSLFHLENTVQKSCKNFQIQSPNEFYTQNAENEFYTIHSGIAEGKLIGGNLSLIVSLLGTEYEVDTKGKLLFIEDIGEEPYRIDRMLTQLLLAKKLQNAAGIVFGIFSKCEASNPERSFSLKEMLLERMASLTIPCFYGLSFGHIPNHCTLPVGIKARINADTGTLTFLESATK